MKRYTKFHEVAKTTNGLALVLERAVSGVCVFILLVSPITPVFASEGENISVDAVAEEVNSVVEADTSVSDESEETTDNQEVVEEQVEETDGTPSEDSVTEVFPQETPDNQEVVEEQVEETDGTTSEDSVTEVFPQVTPETSVEEKEPVNTEEEPEAESEPHNSDNVPETKLEESEEVPITDSVVASSSEVTTSDSELLDEENVRAEHTETNAEAASSTEDKLVSEEVLPDPLITEDTPVMIVMNDTSAFKFEKNECVVTGGDSENGTYFCTKSKAVPQSVRADGVYAMVDEEGDKEIYSEKDGEIVALTKNSITDDAPQYDEVSNTVVWQRDVDGRYQIMELDLTSGEEKQITFDRYNNMQPSRSGDTTVWQGWVGSDWEIFALTGDELVMLTDNTIQDIDPSINGSHIVWQSFDNNAWKMKVYDMRTNHTETIEDANGGSVENPRFVLVYDTKFESGDIETRGYDIATGEVVPLSATPAPLPEKIPDPDQTGEDRALVAPPSQPKSKIDGEDDSDLDTEPENTDLLPVIDEGILVIPSLDSASSTVVEIGTTTPETTLVIDPIITENASSTAHIEDVVVPPFEPDSATSTDSQLDIAETE